MFSHGIFGSRFAEYCINMSYKFSCATLIMIIILSLSQLAVNSYIIRQDIIIRKIISILLRLALSRTHQYLPVSLTCLYNKVSVCRVENWNEFWRPEGRQNSFQFPLIKPYVRWIGYTEFLQHKGKRSVDLCGRIPVSASTSGKTGSASWRACLWLFVPLHPSFRKLQFG